MSPPAAIGADELTEAIAAANPIALRAAVWIQTGDLDLLRMPAARARAASHLMQPLTLTNPVDVQRVRSAAKELIGAIGASERAPRQPTRAELPTIIELLTGAPPDEATLEFWWEEFAAEQFARRPDPIDIERLAATFPDLHVVIVGAGMGGISAAVMLQAAGVPFTIVEKNGGLGGTWYANTYPGVRVDVPSRAYSFTFEPDYPFRHHFTPQHELLEYLEYAAARRGIRERIVFDTEVTELAWNAATQRWSVSTRHADGSAGMLSGNFVVSAVGLFSQAREPDLAGLDTFSGVAMHTSAWDHSVPLDGRRIGVVGTGSSGIQVVHPLSEVAGHLTVFQRTASWLGHMPRYTEEIPVGERWLLAHMPCYVNCVRAIEIYARGDSRESVHEVDPTWRDPDSVSEVNAAIRARLLEYMHTELGGDAELIEKCTPHYPAMAKRLPMDNGWYAALRRPHVDLETRPIRRVVPRGIELADGDVCPLDVLVLATGFRAGDYLWPLKVTGRGGTQLSAAWEPDGPRAYLGMVVPGFPNLFCLYGPNTNPTSGGPCMWGEMQARFVAESIAALARAGARTMEVRSEVFDAFNRLLDERLSCKIWLDPRQKSYITNDQGRVVTSAPWKTREYWAWTRRPNLDEYLLDGGE